MSDVAWLRNLVRDVHDFPTAGVVFKDLTPVFGDPDALRFTVDAICDHFAGQTVDRVAAIEARGFIVAAPVAYRFGAGLVPVRKPGKLPGATERLEYALEYGTDALEVHADAVEAGERVLVVDDVLATGGTAAATVELIERLGAQVMGLAFVLELAFLHGRKRLDGHDLLSLLVYEDA